MVDVLSNWMKQACIFISVNIPLNKANHEWTQSHGKQDSQKERWIQERKQSSIFVTYQEEILILKLFLPLFSNLVDNLFLLKPWLELLFIIVVSFQKQWSINSFFVTLLKFIFMHFKKTTYTKEWVRILTIFKIWPLFFHIIVMETCIV